MATKAKLPSTATGRRRLLKLADLLEADARNRKGIRFDYDDFGTVEDASRPMSCGTTACAMGLAALSGAFKSAGLTYGLLAGEYVTVSMGHHSGLDAAEKLFALNYEQALFLFGGTDGKIKSRTGAKAERAVAKRIRDFVAGKIAA